MMTLHRGSWPQIDLLQREMNRLFDRYPSNGVRPPAAFPPVNIWRGHDGVSLTVNLPGYEPDQVEVSTIRNVVTIRGNRPTTEVGEGQTQIANERRSGEFLRSLELPFDVDTDKTSATFDNGVLMISLARPEEEKPKKIRIKAG